METTKEIAKAVVFMAVYGFTIRVCIGVAATAHEKYEQYVRTKAEKAAA